MNTAVVDNLIINMVYNFFCENWISLILDRGVKNIEYF